MKDIIEPTTYDEFMEVNNEEGWDEAIKLIDDNPANSDNLLALATGIKQKIIAKHLTPTWECVII